MSIGGIRLYNALSDRDYEEAMKIADMASDSDIGIAVDHLLDVDDRDGITFLIDEGFSPPELVYISIILSMDEEQLLWISQKYTTVRWDIICETLRSLYITKWTSSPHLNTEM